MNAKFGSSSLHGLETEISEVSTALRGGLVPILEEISGVSQRPASLARSLGIDKSLSGRILRSIKATEPFEVVHNAPAPYGLRLFVEAAERKGINPGLCRRAESAIARFESLIQSFPDGRTALEAAISDHLPEVRARNERAARQAAYKSMSYLMGYQAEGTFHASVISPSSDNNSKLDFMHISGLHGLRRLRGRAPMILFGLRGYDPSPDEPARIETIDGEPHTQDASRYLLSDFCSRPMPDLKVHKEGLVTHLVLRAASVPANTPVTLVNGWVSRNGSLRYRSEHRTHEWHSGFIRVPARVRVQDYFIHRDVLPGTPDLRARLQGLVSSHEPPAGDEVHVDQVDINVSLESMGSGLSPAVARNAAVPGYEGLLRQVFDRSGHSISDFRVYRCEVVYPVPFVSLTAWFELPEAPSSR
ncbi:MAG: hypothetical protein KDB18_07085 [Salinibacterium sp.]|nr:hypothetical protein [Salinibacterium sp.]